MHPKCIPAGGRGGNANAAGVPGAYRLFANLLEEDMELEMMQMGDPLALTQKFLTEELPRRVPHAQAAVFFNCSGRMWTAQGGGFVAGLSEVMKSAPPCVGFDVYFEIYCGFHINTTLTSLVFGASS